MTEVAEHPQLEDDVPPDPAALIESMRAFGYSLPTAVADLIDNSISAGARTVDVEFEWAGPDSTLTVIDDGSGMDEDALREAMRLGSRSPVEIRAATDLGRFGIGLKSAAWSQARSLTVVSKPDGGGVLLRRWDLDHVSRTRRWSLLHEGTPLADEIAGRLSSYEHGTGLLTNTEPRCFSNVSIGLSRMPHPTMTLPGNDSWPPSGVPPCIQLFRRAVGFCG